MKMAILLDHVSKRFKRYPTRGHTTLKDRIVRGEFLRRHPPQYVEALKDVSVSVPESTVLGIIGPNGAGKSTLLRLVAGIYLPTSGQLSINGRLSALLNLGLGFHPELTGYENIIISGLASGLSRRQIESLAAQIVRFAEIEDFIDAPVRTYSSGMYMRLAFSVAVNVNPEILILDEILSVGDAHFIEKSRERMEAFKKQGKTILFVSHDLGAVEDWCHKALWLDGGCVKQCGDAAGVVQAYRSLYQGHGEAKERVHEAVSHGCGEEQQADGEGAFASA